MESGAHARRASTHGEQAWKFLPWSGTSGGTPSRKTTIPAHHRPIKAKSQKATPETKGQKTSQEGNSEDTADGAPSRTEPNESQSQSGKRAEVRTEEAPDAGAEGTTTPQLPGKAGRGQVPWALQGLSKPSNPRPDKMPSLPRQAQQEQVEPKRQQVRARAMTSVFTQIRRRCLKTDFFSSSSSWTPPARDGNLKTHQAPRSPLLKNPAKQRPYDPDRRTVQLDAGTTASTITPTTSWTGNGLRAKANTGVARNQRYPDSFAAPPVQSSTERKALPTENA